MDPHTNAPKISPCDLPADADSLNLNVYTHGLVSFISTCPLPMTISLQGSWGSGKSSMMNLLEKSLKETALCISFNTWQYSQFDLGDQLPILFYRALMEKLGKTKEQKDKEEEQKLQELCKKGLGLAARLTARHFGVEELMDEVQTTFKDSTKSKTTPTLTETVEGLRKSFQDLVVARLKQEKKERAIFFVDDLDRLPPARAVELMEVLKTVLECPHCVFVLAIDYEVVLRGVKAKYGDSFGTEKGRSFFDKMIQLPFDLPVEQYQMDDFLDGLINSLGDEACRRALLDDASTGISTLPTNRRYVHDMALLSAGRNPRSLKRLFNSFALLSQVARASAPRMQNESYVLLFGIVALKTAYPKLYDYLMKICHSSLDLIEFYNWFHSDEGWARLQASTRAATLGLADLSDLERNRVRFFLSRFFRCKLLPIEKPGEYPPTAPEGIDLTDNECWLLSREGLPFPASRWQELEEALEASSGRSFWKLYDSFAFLSKDGNLRFLYLAAFLNILTRTAEKNHWDELDMPRLMSCWNTMAYQLSDQDDPLAVFTPIDDSDTMEGYDLPPRHVPESEFWLLFEQFGAPSIHEFRLLLEQALRDGTNGGDALDRLVELGERFSWNRDEETVEPFHTPERREARIRAYFIPPQPSQEYLDRMNQLIEKALEELGSL